MNWKTIELKNLCEVFQDGDWIESKDQSPSGIRLIQTGNVGVGYFRDKIDKSRFISTDTFTRLNCNEIFPNDCLISRLPDPVGRACLLPDIGSRMITAVDCTILRFDEKIIIPKFFIYYTQSNKYLFDVDKNTTGTTRKRISKNNLSKIKIPIPPLSEQQRIVDILDQSFAAIDQAIENTEKNLQKSKELFNNYLDNIFLDNGEWNTQKLGNVSFITDGAHNSPKNNDNGDYMYITAKNIKTFGLDLSNVTYILKEDHQKIYKRCPVKRGDILYIKDGATTGIATINTLDEEFSLLSSVALIRPFSEINNKFLVYYMNSNLGKENFLGNIGGVAITRLTITKLKNVIISYPSKEKQTYFVEKLDNLRNEIEELVKSYSTKLTLLQELKQSLLHKAFQGEL